MKKTTAAGLLLVTASAWAHPEVEDIAIINQQALVEASGLARSQLNNAILWAMNDGGSKPRVYAFDETGSHRGRLTLDPARNRDWEDLASFTLDGKPYLLVGDIGDNDSTHGTSLLYVVEEPDLEADDKVRSEPAWTVEYRYPDGPRDAEAMTVDIATRTVYILSKRTLPPVLYSVPLMASDGIVTATRHGEILSLEEPRKIDVDLAPRTKDWWWQPVAMDIAEDGKRAAVLSYRNIYVYDRDEAASWLESLNSEPTVISLGGHREAESVALSPDGESVYATIERRYPPLLKAPIREPDRAHTDE